MTNREYLEEKIEKIKSGISSFIERNITPIALVFTIVEASLIILAIKISPLFWILSVPFAFVITVFVCAFVCEWLDNEHKG